MRALGEISRGGERSEELVLEDGVLLSRVFTLLLELRLCGETLLVTPVDLGLVKSVVAFLA